MRYELNSDEDKIIDIEAIGDNGVLGLKNCCKIMNEQEATIQSLKEEIKKLNGKLYNCEKFRYQVFQGLNELNRD